MNIKSLTNSLLNFLFSLVEIFLVLRFVLKLFGANAGNGFVGWIYDMSSVLLEPFRSIFPTKVFENTYVLEFSTLFAMLFYAIVAIALMELVRILTGSVSTAKNKK